MKLEFLGILGKVLRSTTTEERPVDEIRADLDAFFFPFEPKVHSVRITTGDGRRILHRRPSYEGQAPRVRVQSLQERAAEDAAVMCDCDVFADAHNTYQHALRAAVAPRFPRQRDRRAV